MFAAGCLHPKLRRVLCDNERRRTAVVRLLPYMAYREILKKVEDIVILKDITPVCVE